MPSGTCYLCQTDYGDLTECGDLLVCHDCQRQLRPLQQLTMLHERAAVLYWLRELAAAADSPTEATLLTTAALSIESGGHVLVYEQQGP